MMLQLHSHSSESAPSHWQAAATRLSRMTKPPTTLGTPASESGIQKENERRRRPGVSKASQSELGGSKIVAATVVSRGGIHPSRGLRVLRSQILSAQPHAPIRGPDKRHCLDTPDTHTHHATMLCRLTHTANLLHEMKVGSMSKDLNAPTGSCEERRGLIRWGCPSQRCCVEVPAGVPVGVGNGLLNC